MRLIYVPYVPCRHEHFLLSGRKILADQMDYLAPSLPAHSRARKEDYDILGPFDSRKEAMEDALAWGKENFPKKAA